MLLIWLFYCSFQGKNCFFLPPDHSYQPTEVIRVTILHVSNLYTASKIQLVNYYHGNHTMWMDLTLNFVIVMVTVFFRTLLTSTGWFHISIFFVASIFTRHSGSVKFMWAGFWQLILLELVWIQEKYSHLTVHLSLLYFQYNDDAAHE